jgi:hypothetical protein
METKDQDWPYLNKYRKENAAIDDLESGKTELFLGDSITEFCIVHPNSFVVNPTYRGISGQTSPQMFLRFRADVIDLKPTIVVLRWK